MKRVAVMLTLAALVALCAAPASAVVINAAAYGTATQSSYRAGSTTQGDHAQYAVDGITNGNFNSGSVTHTNGQTDPWWEVDLKAVRTIEDIVAEGDRVVTRESWRGTHEGEFMGIAPTGRQIMIATMSVVRISDGRIVEYWEGRDRLQMLEQLGAVPPMGEGSE